MRATNLLRIWVFVVISLSANTIYAQRLVNPAATQETKNLKAYMDDIYGQKIISGQYWDNYAVWIKNLTGKTPAILGLDFMDYMPRRKQEGAKPTDTQKAIDWVNNKKGIVTFSWHWDAPADIFDVNYRQECAGTTGGDARWYKAFYSCAVWFDLQNALANPGSTNYNLLIRDIDLVAAELKILQDNGVPVLWRPLHEASGQWFWWGAKGAGPCKELWKLMYNRLVNYHKLNNLIWVWNCYGYEHGNPTDWFPGYDYVDIIAYDYPRSTSWNEYNTIHGNKGKEFALAEVGGLPDPNNLATQGWSYFVTWGDFIQNNNSEAYVKQVYTDPRVITLESLPDLKNYLPTGVNIALKKPVTVSSTEAGFGNVAANAVDGSASTRWSSAYADPQWIQIDLQAAYQLSEIRLKWENAYASAYKIETSTDGITWSTVKQVANGDGGLDIISGLNTTGRYVRVTGTTRATQYGYSLYEVEVYGNASCSAVITASSTSFCQGGNADLTASAGASYKWFNGTTQVGTAQTYTAAVAGSYTVEVTNAAGCKATSAATSVTVNTAPTATIINNGPTTFCEGASVTLTASNGSSYKWMNGTTTVGTAATYNASAAGSYTVEVTNAAGCKATSAAVTVTVNATPTASITANGPTTFCEGGSVTLTASIGASYVWKNGTATVGTAATYKATAAGSYAVEVTNANGCKATSAATTVIVNSAPAATITASGPTAFCEGGSVTLAASSGSGYVWKNGTTTVGTAATFNATAAGSYTVEVTNAAGCKATSSATTVTVNPVPTASITANGPTTFCEGGSVTLTASSGSSYKWMNGTATVGTTATYNITANGPTTFCEGGSVTLTASTGSSYKWMNGTATVGTAATFNATASGSYTVEVTNANGCKATSSATTVTVNPVPTASITANGPTTFCEGGSVTLTASTGASYVWKNGTATVGTAATYNAAAAGSYTVEITNANGCKATSSATTVTVNPVPTASITANGPTTFCEGGSVTLTASNGSSYKWMNGTATVGTSATYNATAAGSYTVEVANANACKATSPAIMVTVGPASTWYQDLDNDGMGDAATTLQACEKPTGYVAVAGDACPMDENKTQAGNCGCGATESSCVDCNGDINGTASIDACQVCSGGNTGITPSTDAGNCGITTGVDQQRAMEKIRVAPNPFSDRLSVSIANILSYQLMDMNGRIVLEEETSASSINTSSIANGLYILRIVTTTGIEFVKVEKQN